MGYKVEFHTHTFPASCDSRLSVCELIDTLRDKGYAGVVISNHYDNDQLIKYKGLREILSICSDCSSCRLLKNTLEITKENMGLFYQMWLGDIRVAKAYGEQVGVKVYAGCEYTTDSTHVSILGMTLNELEGIKEPITERLSVKDLREHMKMFKGILFIQNHPLRDSIVENEVDGYEIINTKHGETANSIEFIKSNIGEERFKDCINIIGGDVHKKSHAGKGAVVFEELPIDEKELANKLRNKEYRIEEGI